ncbi:glycosyltransferase family 2 protein [Candidatus Roizmanbacteria bacterium]|nr:glycosyltransferase family 2 protein [Candidatus Roizmanbacteria bacterium]
MSHKKLDIMIAIPAYNCEKQITRVLDEIDDKLASRVREICVIDNISTDNTVSTLLKYRKNNNLKGKLKILQNAKNYSLGGSHKVAFLRAESNGYSHVIILHGDNQAKSDEANLLIDYVEKNPQVHTVLGSRFNKKSQLIGYDIKRIVGNKILNSIYSIVTLRHCEDLGSGLNLFAIKDLSKNSYLRFADKLTFNFELLLDLIGRKINFSYVPITWREEDQVTNARNFNVFKIAIYNLIRWRLGISNRAINTINKYESKEIN